MPSREEVETPARPTATARKPRFSVEDDTLRILISTDNHLGYAERDPVRGNDSFAAFEEILYLAQKFSVDMVLIAGDLFHENRPTRHTMHKTMDIMRRYCMGPNPVKIRLLSEAARNFRSGQVNYLDPNYSVHLPVFSIHGNHDDPSRDAGTRDLLAALDLLSVSNFINYFGRQDEIDKIEISPVIIEKGSTQVAIYGLGAMREARLNRMWATKKVQFLRPEEDEDNGDKDEEDALFNIFALHQNRDYGRGAKNCIQESMIPDWMDIVIWGHEHESLIDFSESVVGTFRISQPGSSIATSLVVGEAVRKQIGILDIKGKRYRMHTVPLTQVRSFVTCDVSLKDCGLDIEDPKIDEKVHARLEKEVLKAIKTARDRIEEVKVDALAAGNDAGADGSPLKNFIEKPKEVLVRIRVEHSGFSTINNQRFGARFVGDVANANDILLFHRRKELKPITTKKISDKQRQNFLKTPIDPDTIERLNMEDLVLEFFDNKEKQERSMKILDTKKLTESLVEYVEKHATSTIDETTDYLLKRGQKALLEKSENQNMAVTGSAIREFFDEEQRAKNDDDDRAQNEDRNRSVEPLEYAMDAPMENGSSREADGDAFEEVSRQKKRRSGERTSKPKPCGSQLQRSRVHETKDSSGDDEDDETPAKPVKASTRSKRVASMPRKRYKLDSDDESDSDDVLALDDDDSDMHPRKRGRAPASKQGKPTTLASKARKSSSAMSKKQSRLLNDSDNDSSENGLGTGSFEHEHWGSTATKSQL